MVSSARQRQFRGTRRAAFSLGLAFVVASGCDDDAPPPAPPSAPAPPAPAPPAPRPVDAGPTLAAPSLDAAQPPSDAEPPTPEPKRDGCPEGMLRVEGSYCPAVVQQCLEHHPEYANNKGSKTVSERCLRYKEPSRCVSKERRELAFCIDRYEYPNRKGELPRVLTSWLEARKLCAEQGKRLCTVDEFNFACEGPEMRPYVNGFVRDAEKCNIDREYRYPDHSKRMLTYEACLKDERCSAELERLDQRHAIGARESCISWAGVVDMNGNVNEWVEREHKPPPHRSGLKGGWWGPVRNRCRPTVEFHKEHDYGYEAGFRCCADLETPASPAPGE